MTPEEIQAIMPEGYGGDWELTCQGENNYMNFGLRLDEVLSYEYEVEGCQALHSGSKCLHCNEDPCPHCKRWGGRQRTEVRSMVDKNTKQALISLIKELALEARIYELELAKISPKFKIEERIAKLQAELEEK